MTTGTTPVTKASVATETMLDHYLWHGGQSRVQDRLARGRAAPSVENRVAKASKRLHALGSVLDSSVVQEPESQKMFNELDEIAKRA
ncbi:hypothetical protein FALBO_1816 [Fusarium albosuccineum]|uniref:Uncharacterized protein n=1 Tax=Fusarium albosuccineum TaxID=1237068 RepID=A0A8H4PD75_9HYPO|nr:hypothetical protein FALBO_1816 [Fusarium albosuccineum]KAF5012737.1 hypothetical protein FDECE_1230 [Fusarium decemcellulare]